MLRGWIVAAASVGALWMTTWANAQPAGKSLAERLGLTDTTTQREPMVRFDPDVQPVAAPGPRSPRDMAQNRAKRTSSGGGGGSFFSRLTRRYRMTRPSSRPKAPQLRAPQIANQRGRRLRPPASRPGPNLPQEQDCGRARRP
jgi:hypothetical protein